MERVTDFLRFSKKSGSAPSGRILPPFLRNKKEVALRRVRNTPAPPTTKPKIKALVRVLENSVLAKVKNKSTNKNVYFPLKKMYKPPFEQKITLKRAVFPPFLIFV